MHRAARGEVIRLVLTMMRTSFDIASEFVRRRGLKTDDDTLVLIRKRSGACLTKLQRNGTIVGAEGLNGWKAWRLA